MFNELLMLDTLENLHWIRPLWLLALLPAAGLFLLLLKSNQETNRWKKFIDPDLAKHLLKNAANNKANRSRNLPLIASAIASFIAIFALAGPSWEKLPQPVAQKQDTLIIIADLTLSMYAEDIAPSRLIRMRYKLLELLKQRKEGQTALIAYSGDAHVVSPLTDDAKTIAALVPTLSPEVMPTIGSNASTAFTLADQLFAGQPGAKRKIVWFTDQILNRDHEVITETVIASNSTLIVMGVGSEKGGPIPLPSGKFLKDNSGNRVINAKLDRKALMNIAQNANGYYLDLRSDNTDINFILEKNDSLLSNTNNTSNDERSIQFDSWLDRGAWLSLFILPIALLSFRRGWLVALLPVFFLTLPDNELHAAPDQTENTLTTTKSKPKKSPTFTWQDLWQTRDQQAARLRKNNATEKATQMFNDPTWKGVSSYELGNFEDAKESFDTTIQLEREKSESNPQQLAKNYYNYGHALAKSSKFEEAISAYDKALQLNPQFENAKKSKAIIEELLKQAEQQENNQQQNQQSDDSEQSNSEQSSSEKAQSEQASSEQSQSETNKANQNQQGQSDNNQNSEHSQNHSPSESDEQKDTAQLPDSEESDNENEQRDLSNKQNDQNVGNPEDEQTYSQKDIQDLDEKSAKEQARLQQWLNKIQDDPAGLLRRKFQYERSQRERQGNVVDQSEEGQLW